MLQLAELVFFASYFIAWVVNELPHVIWIDISAIAAIVIVACIVFANRALVDRAPKA
jgi:hypothetical protein